MSDTPFGFDRSGVHDTECEEMAKLARLRLEDTLVETDRTGREMTFGCVVTDSRMEYTGIYKGEHGNVKGRTIKQVHNEMMAINPDGDIRKEYLLHTHPGSPHPSVADVGALVGSMKLDSTDITRTPIPPFDGLFNIGHGPDGQGIIIGLMIDSRPSDSEFTKIVTEYKRMKEEVKGMDRRDKEDRIQQFIKSLSENIRTCESEFRLVQL